jgi:hypothetical protein
MPRNARARWMKQLPTWGLALLDEAQNPEESRDKNHGSTVVLPHLPPSNETETTMAMGQNGTTTQPSNSMATHTANGESVADLAAALTKDVGKDVQQLSKTVNDAVGELRGIQKSGLRQTRTLKSAAVDAAVIAAGVTLAAGTCYGVYKLGQWVAGDN